MLKNKGRGYLEGDKTGRKFGYRASKLEAVHEPRRKAAHAVCMAQKNGLQGQWMTGKGMTTTKKTVWHSEKMRRRLFHDGGRKRRRNCKTRRVREKLHRMTRWQEQLQEVWKTVEEVKRPRGRERREILGDGSKRTREWSR